MIMRTAEAAGCAGLFLTRGSVELFNPKVVRATMGAIFRLPTFSRQNGTEVLTELRQHNIPILAAHINGTPFHNLQTKNPVALLLGNEAFGIDPDLLALANHTVTIPMNAPVESLNIAVATGILLYKLHELNVT
jgi:TrmH family RNA methyltransferase